VAFPTFLGIGVSRCGTTWLNDLLESHPDIYMSPRKEIAFFSRYYDRGIGWYEGFFPNDAEATQYKAIGEVTPTYWYVPECPERIARVPSIRKLIMVIRNPIERAYSDYGLRVKNGVYSGSFEDYPSFRPQSLAWGFYSAKIKSFLQYFDRDQLLILIFEEMMADVVQSKQRLAGFLQVDPDRFPGTIEHKKINRSYVPKARWAYALAYKVSRSLRYKWDMDWVVNVAKRLGIERAFGEGERLPPMNPETRQRLRGYYRNEIVELEGLLDADLSAWR